MSISENEISHDSPTKQEMLKYPYKDCWEIEDWEDEGNEINPYICTVEGDEYTFSIDRKNTEFLSIDISTMSKNYPLRSAITFMCVNHIKNETNNTKTTKYVFNDEKTKESVSFAILQGAITERSGFIFNGMFKIEITIEKIPVKEPLKVATQSYVPSFHNYTINRFVEQKPVPYVGLRNQGATCYMNSMLQALFHLPAFRKLIFLMDPYNGSKTDTDNIPLNLQRLFAQMQLLKNPCSTKDLTKSFGWGDYESIMQHDVQEFCRVLIDNLETKMQKTDLDGTIASLFRGKYESFIRCKDVDYSNSKLETFYDLSLVVKDNQSLEDSFRKYVETEELEGDNQYDAGEYGKQNASMGIEFIEFPSVLHLHLRRFQYDYTLNSMTKINSYFSFPRELDLSELLVTDDVEKKSSAKYELFGVLVHSGTANGGHYYAYLRTTKSNDWYEFNDSTVSHANENDVIDGNFGGSDPNSTYPNERSFSAYMLVYVRKNQIDDLYQEVKEEDIPESIRKYVRQIEVETKKKEEEKLEKENTLELNVSSIYPILSHNAQINVFSYRPKKPKIRITIKKYNTFEELYKIVGQAVSFNPSHYTLYQLEDFGEQGLKKILPTFQRINDSFRYSQYVFFIKKDVQELNDDDYMSDSDQDEDGFLISIFLYLPILKYNPFRFYGNHIIQNEQDIKDYLDSMSIALGLKSSESFHLLHIRREKDFEPIDIDSIMKIKKEGMMILVYLDNPTKVKESYKDLLDRKSIQIPSKDIVYTKSNIKRPKDPKDYLEYLTDTVKIIIKFNKGEYSFVFPKAITYSQMLRYILSMLSKKFNSRNDLALLFDEYRTKPILIENDESIRQIDIKKTYYKDTVLDLYTFPNTTHKLKKMTRRIMIFFDNEVYTYFLPKNYLVAELITSLQKEYSTENLRLVIFTRDIMKIINDDVQVKELPSPLYAQKTPYDQIEMNEGEKLITVVMKKMYYSTSPAIRVFFKLYPDEKWEITKQRLEENILTMNTREIQCYVATADSFDLYNRKLEDDDITIDLFDKEDLYMLVQYLEDNSQTSTTSTFSSSYSRTHRQESVKILN